MESTETIESRLEMVDMHAFFLERIEHSMEEKNYVEASWYIYSCMENRFFRTLLKFKGQCKYCKGKCKKNKNELALRTKINCVKRLVENQVSCLSDNFTVAQLEAIKKWVKKRNDLMHDLLSLEEYKNMDLEFEKVAKAGKNLLSDLYTSCSRFRAAFYSDGYEFVFPESAMEGCPCGYARED